MTSDEEEAEELLVMLEDEECKLVDIDLQACRVTLPNGSVHPFTLDLAHCKCLLQLLGFVTLASRYEDDIAAFQQRARQMRLWSWQWSS